MDLLDLDAVRAFVQVADLSSFTRAAHTLGTTQSAVSLKLKRLEAQLGQSLLERTPRSVRLSQAGAAFLDSARELLEAHTRAVTSIGVERRRLRIGLSEHVAGADLHRIVAALHRHDPRLVVEMHLGLSAALHAQYEDRQLDACIVRYELDEAPRWSTASDAEHLFVEPLAWLAAPGFRLPPGEAVPLATITGSCAVRAVAIRALEHAGIPWREAFVGGGIAAVGAAVAAGLAVCALARRIAPPGVLELDAAAGLPALPEAQIVLHSRVREPHARSALRMLVETLARR